MNDLFVNPQQELTHAELVSWVRLIRTQNIGPVTFQKLLSRFGSAQTALDALPEIMQRGGARKTAISSVEAAEAEIDAVEQLGGKLVTPQSASYPPLLRHIDSPPPLLTMLGKALPAFKCVAIVGSRNASAAGRRMTRDIAHALGEAGYHIVSGLARGIDAVAHEAALGTGTSAVIAGGINRIYPPENIDLLHQLSENGAALTEMPLNWQATARCFPRRNRIVSGMSLATVVIEAAERSGSLITARLAAEQGREVFALPGSPLDPRASGTNRLIKQGAQMATSAEDIIEALAQLPQDLPFMPMRAGEEDFEFAYDYESNSGAEGEHDIIIELLGPSPIVVDHLIRESKIAPARVHALLLELELAGRIEMQGGQRVALISPELGA